MIEFNEWSTKRLLCAALLIAVTLPVFAGFRDVADAIDRHRGLRRVWTPGLGLARFAVWIVQPKGVHDFQLVRFEGSEDIDPNDLSAIMKTHAGPGFTPLVRAWSKKSGEWSFVYARPHPNSTSIELMVLAHDDDDTVLVRVDVDASIIAREIQEPRSVQKYARQ